MTPIKLGPRASGEHCAGPIRQLTKRQPTGRRVLPKNRNHFVPIAVADSQLVVEIAVAVHATSLPNDAARAATAPRSQRRVGDSYAVVEARTGATGETIRKKDVNQLAGSVNWFREQYGKNASLWPVIVHPRSEVDRPGTPPDGTRVLTEERLEALID